LIHVRARVYVIPLSNPSAAGVAMVAHKRIPYRVVRLMPGMHPLLVRAAGFEGMTVPGLELDGRKIQGTLSISRALDEARPDPPLFPSDPALRARVEDAERWGEAELQPVPRRVFRFALLRDPALRRWFAGVAGMPLPGVASRLAPPVIARLAARTGAHEGQVRTDLQRLPELMDQVDALIADGTIGADRPNAADFQILATVRVLLEAEDLVRHVRGRRCEAAARRLYPTWLGPVPASTALTAVRGRV
jgi:glutathione S-transferase